MCVGKNTQEMYVWMQFTPFSFNKKGLCQLHSMAADHAKE